MFIVADLVSLKHHRNNVYPSIYFITIQNRIFHFHTKHSIPEPIFHNHTIHSIPEHIFHTIQNIVYPSVFSQHILNDM